LAADSVKILADVREASAGVGRSLLELGVHVDWMRLQVGDYLLPGGVVVERKTVPDFHKSVRSGRLWRQVTMIKRACPRGVVIVEGVNLDGGPLGPDAVRGALLELIDQELPVLRSAGPRDTAVWLRRLALRGSGQARRPRRRAYVRSATPAALLASIKGISRPMAAALLETFGSIAAIAAASDEELRKIDGIGPVRAAAVTRILTERFSTGAESAELSAFSASAEKVQPGRALRLRDEPTGGIHVAGSGRAEPLHLGGDP
jgi:ERCC4-type nuclease